MDVNVKSRKILKKILPALVIGGDCEDLLSDQLRYFSDSDKIVLEKYLRRYLYDHNYLDYVELIEGKCIFEYCDDVLWVRINREYEYNVSDDTAGLIVDFDIGGNVVAFEILSASRFFKLSQKELENLSEVIVNVNVNEDVIKFTLSLTVGQIKRHVNGRILNEYGADDGCYVYKSI